MQVKVQLNKVYYIPNDRFFDPWQWIDELCFTTQDVIMGDKNKSYNFNYCLAIKYWHDYKFRLSQVPMFMMLWRYNAERELASKWYLGNKSKVLQFWALSCFSTGEKEATGGQLDVVSWQSVLSNVQKCYYS